MTTLRSIAWMFALTLAQFAAHDAWCADATTAPTQPSSTVSSSGTAQATAPKADASTAKPATTAKPTTPTPKVDDEQKNRDFKPSEEISEDMAVAYPTDI